MFISFLVTDAPAVKRISFCYFQFHFRCVGSIEKLEMLDDRDMLTQLCEHYCLCWAYYVRPLQSGANRNLSSIQYHKISLSRIT